MNDFLAPQAKNLGNRIAFYNGNSSRSSKIFVCGAPTPRVSPQCSPPRDVWPLRDPGAPLRNAGALSEICGPSGGPPRDPCPLNRGPLLFLKMTLVPGGPFQGTRGVPFSLGMGLPKTMDFSAFAVSKGP